MKENMNTLREIMFLNIQRGAAPMGISRCGKEWRAPLVITVSPRN